jgi:excisionase family DNA binding protein
VTQHLLPLTGFGIDPGTGRKPVPHNGFPGRAVKNLNLLDLRRELPPRARHVHILSVDATVRGHPLWHPRIWGSTDLDCHLRQHNAARNTRKHPLAERNGKGVLTSQQLNMEINMTADTADHPPSLHQIPAAMARLSIGRSTIYNLMDSGALRSVKVGKRRLIPESAIAEFISQLEADGAA